MEIQAQRAHLGPVDKPSCGRNSSVTSGASASTAAPDLRAVSDGPSATHVTRGPRYPRRIGPRVPVPPGLWTSSSSPGSRRPQAARTRVGAGSRPPPSISSAAERPLHRHQRAVGRHQRHRPLQQPAQRSHRPGGHHVEPAPAVQLLGPGPASPRRCRARARPPPPRGRWSAAAAARPASPEVRPGDRQHQARGARRRSRCRTPCAPRAPQLAPARRSSAGVAPTAGEPRAARSGRGPRRRSPGARAYRSASSQPVRRKHPPRRVGRGGRFT